MHIVNETAGPNSRVIDVINFLAAHPTESFTLSEIARNVGLSNGSAHRVLTTMSGARFQTDKVMVGIIIIASAGVALTSLLRMVERRFESWRPALHD